jgi:hypothetical protein
VLRCIVESREKLDYIVFRFRVESPGQLKSLPLQATCCCKLFAVAGALLLQEPCCCRSPAVAGALLLQEPCCFRSALLAILQLLASLVKHQLLFLLLLASLLLLPSVPL